MVGGGGPGSEPDYHRVLTTSVLHGEEARCVMGGTQSPDTGWVVAVASRPVEPALHCFAPSPRDALERGGAPPPPRPPQGAPPMPCKRSGRGLGRDVLEGKGP